MGISVSTSQQMRRLQFMHQNRAHQNSLKGDPSTIDIENLPPAPNPLQIVVACKRQSPSQGSAQLLGNKGNRAQRDVQTGLEQINLEERVLRQRKENSAVLRGSRQNILNSVEPLNVSRLTQRVESPPTIRSKKVKMNKRATLLQ